jgi:hypothetical protein
MSRGRLAGLLAVIAALALAGSALAAKALHVSGGTVTITPSDAAATLLSSNGITVTPIAPATASSGTFTFPIAGGRLTAKSLHGVIRERGGVALSNGTSTVKLTHLRLVSSHRGVSLYAVVRRHVSACPPYAIPPRHGHGHGHGHGKCHPPKAFAVAKIARITNVTISNGSATGTVHITAATASIVNNLAGKELVSRGAVLGTATATPTFG